MRERVEINAVPHSVAAVVALLERAVLAAGGGEFGVPDVGRNLAECALAIA